MKAQRKSTDSPRAGTGNLPEILGLFCMIVMCSASIAGPARADMASHFGLSPRAIAMGGAVSAVVEDYGAVYYNPAGLGLVEGSDMACGYSFGYPRVKVSERGGPATLGFHEEIHSILIGYRQDMKRMLPAKWNRRMGICVLAQLQNDLKKGALMNTSFYEDMQFPVFGRAPDMLVVGAGVGVELHKRVHAGVSMRLAVTLDVHNATIAMSVPGPAFEYLNIDTNIDTEARPIAGVMVQPWDWLRLGAVWRRGGPGAQVEVSGVGIADIASLRMPVGLAFNWRDFYTPDEVAGSVAVQPLKHWLIAFELTHARWEGYNIPYDEPPPGGVFQDILIPRLGVEYSLTDTVRFQAGYYYHPTPVKSGQTRTHFLDADEHVFSAGVQYSLHPFKWVFARSLACALFVQYQHIPRRSLETTKGHAETWGSILNMGTSVSLPF